MKILKNLLKLALILAVISGCLLTSCSRPLQKPFIIIGKEKSNAPDKCDKIWYQYQDKLGETNSFFDDSISSANLGKNSIGVIISRGFGQYLTPFLDRKKRSMLNRLFESINVFIGNLPINLVRLSLLNMLLDGFGIPREQYSSNLCILPPPNCAEFSI